jgi:branched-chain amino acid transport system permease protein
VDRTVVARRGFRELVDDELVRRWFNRVTFALLFYFGTQYFWHPPLGVLVQGTIIGGLTAMISFGIALVYRANRIVNFAQGDLGGAPAALMVLLIAKSFPYFLSLGVGLVAAIALGVVVEFVFIRRFFRAPRLILTVATIGLSQILAAVGILLPRLFNYDTPPQSFPSPFDFRFTISPIIFRGNDIMAMVTIGASIFALTAFLRYTNIGIAIRASAESADRAFLLGIPVKRIHTTVWVMATVLATVGMFLRAGITGLPFGRVLAPAILLRALAAAVLGRFENLPVIFFTAVGIGIIEQSIVWHTRASFITPPILFLIVLVALLFQRRGAVARADDESTWQATREIRRTPRELAKVPEVWFGLRGAVGLLGAVVLLLPVFLSESRTNLFAAIMIYAIVGVSLVILTGWAGQVSIGQMAFVGIGAAVAGSLTSRAHWDLTIAVVVAGLAGALAALVIGLPALRIRGLQLAVVTLAFAGATSDYLLNKTYFGRWLPAFAVDRLPLFGRVAIKSETRFYYLCLAGLLLAVIAARGVRWSRTGRVLIGVRENERAAQAFGVNATRAKLTAFAMSGFLAAYAGALFVHHQEQLTTTPFAVEQSLNVFTMVVIGGLGSIPGALLGAIYIRGVAWFLPLGFRFLASGVGILLILIMIPGGLGSVMYQVRDLFLRTVARRRRIIVPSLIADTRSEDLSFQERKTVDFLELAQMSGLAAPAGDGEGHLAAEAAESPNGEPERRRRRTRAARSAS